MSDSVNHPSHYGGDTTYEVIKVAEAWGFDKDAYLFNILKYIARPDKGAYLEDLKKAQFYLSRKIGNLEHEQEVSPEVKEKITEFMNDNDELLRNMADEPARITGEYRVHLFDHSTLLREFQAIAYEGDTADDFKLRAIMGNSVGLSRRPFRMYVVENDGERQDLPSYVEMTHLQYLSVHHIEIYGEWD